MIGFAGSTKHKTFDGLNEFGLDINSHLNPEISKGYLDKKRMEKRQKAFLRREKYDSYIYQSSFLPLTLLSFFATLMPFQGF
jgi:hypothetical protein